MADDEDRPEAAMRPSELFAGAVQNVAPTNGMTEQEAQDYHDRRKNEGTRHYLRTNEESPAPHFGGCWCCCRDCDDEGVCTPSSGDMVLQDGTHAQYLDITVGPGQSVLEAFQAALAEKMGGTAPNIIATPEQLAELEELTKAEAPED